ncbi:hypothetical protein GYMLUDRAFT_63023 [Collybiopsis luxurians FD-317 M1]|uniref:Unplaced genomic scaffold GYMLUscaffold_66, whole genome shotgun sequence n=1 Tax=Collybiopsis luxurians FD-317 M1 TaxID=944289 RepID=A0A0D0C9I2_9AGAR|nr:hypothetical protein GYMLUDRAFT_63023 [Collybiopsis luxurians FD-317 M1]
MASAKPMLFSDVPNNTLSCSCPSGPSPSLAASTAISVLSLFISILGSLLIFVSAGVGTILQQLMFNYFPLISGSWIGFRYHFEILSDHNLSFKLSPFQEGFSKAISFARKLVKSHPERIQNTVDNLLSRAEELFGRVDRNWKRPEIQDGYGKGSFIHLFLFIRSIREIHIKTERTYFFLRLMGYMRNCVRIQHEEIEAGQLGRFFYGATQLNMHKPLPPTPSSPTQGSAQSSQFLPPSEP